MSPEKIAVDVEGHTLTLTNLEKVLYPEVGVTTVVPLPQPL